MSDPTFKSPRRATTRSGRSTTLVLAVIALHATVAGADDVVTTELTGPFESVATLCESWKTSACRPVRDGATEFTETNTCTCRQLDALAQPRAALVVLDQIIDDKFARGGHIVLPLRDYAIAMWHHDAWWLSSSTLSVEMHGGALASNCCESHAGPPWYSIRAVSGRVVLQTGQDVWRTAKATGGWQAIVEPLGISSAVMACDANHCSVVPVAHCTEPSAPIYRIADDRIRTGCSDARLTEFDLPK